jgi:4-hydroxy-tetrahydrodipicolinate reductase
MHKKVIIVGVNGKMGSVTRNTIENHPDFKLVAGLSKGDDLQQALTKHTPDIVIDFTNAESVYKNAMLIIENNCHPIIGSTGLLEKQVNHLSELCANKNLGAIIAPNFSLGALLMMKLSAQVSAYFSEVEIVETHHQQKQDAPSGTALKTAELIAANRQHAKNELESKELFAGARGATYKNINIHARRLPGTIANQEVIFGSLGETLSINHTTINRECFMPGVIMACKEVTELDKMIYGLEHLLD